MLHSEVIHDCENLVQNLTDLFVSVAWYNVHIKCLPCNPHSIPTEVQTPLKKYMEMWRSNNIALHALIGSSLTLIWDVKFFPDFPQFGFQFSS